MPYIDANMELANTLYKETTDAILRNLPAGHIRDRDLIERRLPWREVIKEAARKHISLDEAAKFLIKKEAELNIDAAGAIIDALEDILNPDPDTVLFQGDLYDAVQTIITRTLGEYKLIIPIASVEEKETES